MKLEIVVADQTAAFQAWEGSPVPPVMQLRGFHSVTLAEAGYELTQALLTQHMGWTLLRESGGVIRYQAPGGGPASIVDIVSQPNARHGLPGVGTVHHVAFRVDDAAVQLAWQRKLMGDGYSVSLVRDRNYFRSIYYREPGGVLFEIATNPPGFAIDESPDALGSELKLPPQYESSRKDIEAVLPPLVAGAA